MVQLSVRNLTGASATAGTSVGVRESDITSGFPAVFAAALTLLEVAFGRTNSALKFLNATQCIRCIPQTRTSLNWLLALLPLHCRLARHGEDSRRIMTLLDRCFESLKATRLERRCIILQYSNFPSPSDLRTNSGAKRTLLRSTPSAVMLH